MRSHFCVPRLRVFFLLHKWRMPKQLAAPQRIIQQLTPATVPRKVALGAQILVAALDGAQILACVLLMIRLDVQRLVARGAQ